MEPTRKERCESPRLWPKITNAADCHSIQTVGKQAPHPKGYRPDLPLVSSHASVMAWARGVELAAHKRRTGDRRGHAPKTVISKTQPHPQSYRPDLPLDGFTVAQLIRPTKEDRIAWAARPLTYDPNSDGPRFEGDEPRRPIACDVGRDRFVIEPDAMALLHAASESLESHTEAAPGPSEEDAADRQPVTSESECKRSQSERDAIRRAYIAWIKGTALVVDGQYMLKNARGESRPAPWATIVAAAFPDVHAFNNAARAWQSPKNQRTLATH